MEGQVTIEFAADCYDGDWLIGCKVTYPGIYGRDPVTVKYDSLYDEDPEKVAKRAAEDIAEWMQDPDGWMENYLLHRSSNEQHRLQEMRRNLEHYQAQVIAHNDSAASYQKYVEQTEQQIATLEARLAGQMPKPRL